MQRLTTMIVALVLVLATGLNITLLLQNQQLRRQVAAAPPPASPQPAAEPQKLAQLASELERYKQDLIKSSREANTLREQVKNLQPAAQERDTLKVQFDSLQQENQQLRNEVTNLQTMNGINGQVTTLRGLAPLGSVPREFMNHDQLREYFTASMDEQFPPEEQQRQQAILLALDMYRGTPDLRAAQIDSMVESVLGFYNQETKQLVVVTERPKMGVQDRITYAHEYVHSLQDQHYDLTALFARADGNGDYQLAIHALVEGDATLSMDLYAEAHLDALDIAKYKLEHVEDMDLTDMFIGGESGPLVESATYFPYQEGASFVALLYELGGWEAITQAFQNPPRSTEQVLHPEKYYAGEQPVQVQLPNLAAALGGDWRLMTEDTLGELYTRIYLEHQLPFEQAIPAGEGWGGDRYQVLQNSQGRVALALQTAWDSPADAQEFFDTYRAFVSSLSGGNLQQLAAGPTNARWQLAGRQFYLGQAGNRVLVLHAPDAATLDALVAQLPGF